MSTTLIQAQETIRRIAHSADDTLVTELTATFGSFEQQRAHGLALLGELDARDMAPAQGSPDVSAWLATFFGQSERAAADYRTVARRLREAPRFLEHYLTGNLSYSNVRLALRYLTEENHDTVLDLALNLTHAQLRRELSGLPDNDDPPRPAERFTYSIDQETGWLRFSGQLNPEHGAAFLAALKIGELAGLRALKDTDVPADLSPAELLGHLDEKLAAEAVDDTPATSERPLSTDDVLTPPAEEHLSAATAAAADHDVPEDQRGGWEDDGGPPVDHSPGRRMVPAGRLGTRFGSPRARTRLMGLMSLAHIARSTPTSLVRAPGAEVHLIIGPDGLPRIPEHLGEEASRFLDTILNGMLQIHFQDPAGAIIASCRRSRVLPKKVEEALLTQWGHQCAGPGCPNTRFLEFHHIHRYAQGGPTDTVNLVLLCSGCHALVTEGTVTVHIDEHDPARIHFRYPGGRSFTSTRRGAPRRNPDADRYFEGPVPKGDEALLQRWDLDNLSFADLA
ncbi:HNH endonuclease [Corynebacterium guangdongense]|uniref:HNH nuclease domain-containing protein n=1 Tax=Corynebacterium guangdongense TaxID=1783348 RepID=A0ABU2A027_9CORY|nr:HNH endonuclease signature motif containing protein [Corynebacterium guangdongense]MDR7330350.1 hypothetical protein [Corynebacterium guangdongense]WJZ18908.1 HNH endonuclease [Corynebacterium guangdongense]